MLLIIDNYDSFVHNLARYCTRLGVAVRVVRNDEIDVSQIRALQPQGVILSPGPCSPNEAGISLELIRELHHELPILGVCLGHQAIAAALGGRIIRASEPMHGRASQILHCGEGVFWGVPSPFLAGRYHSLVVEEATLPPDLQVTARAVDGTIMALAHRDCPLYGVQFHPESILTEQGYPLLSNFLRIAGCTTDQNSDLMRDERPDPRSPDTAFPLSPVTF